MPKTIPDACYTPAGLLPAVSNRSGCRHGPTLQSRTRAYGWARTKSRTPPSPHARVGYRFYEPNLQRWLNRDPIGERGGANLYVYGSNDSVHRIDPLGLIDRTGPSFPLFGPPLPKYPKGDNCYAYACGRPGAGTLDPGVIGGIPKAPGYREGSMSCSEIKRRALADGGKEPGASGACPAGYRMVQYFSGDKGRDYHFRREHADGRWSEKQPQCAPRYVNPRKPYKVPGDKEPYELCGYLCMPD